MQAAILVSLIGHGILIAVMAFGLPSWLEPERREITSTAVGLISAGQLAALSGPQLPPGREATASAAAASAVKKAKKPKKA